MGKNKIEIKKIHNKKYLKATFSKRRQGLFGKASDLCCMTGAQIAIITFSPGNKPFPFGYPSAETVIDRFLSEQASYTVVDHDDEGIGSVDSSDDHAELKASKEKDIEESKEDGMDVDKVKFWWDEPIDDEDLGLHELKKYNGLLRQLRENVASKLDEMNRREFYTRDYLV